MRKVLEGRDASVYTILPTDCEGVKKKKRERRRTLELNMKYLVIQDLMSHSNILVGESIPPVETKRLSKEHILDLVVRSIRMMEGMSTSLDKSISEAIEMIAKEQEQIKLLTDVIEQHQAGLGKGVYLIHRHGLIGS